VTGRVVLIGAGPGDPELITVKGARALGEADVVIFDRLVAPALLDLCRPEAERLYVGKEPGRAAVPQERICSLLVEQAMVGRVVARLKGGDPLVFGRGGEELLACARAGVPCEVIPGITSAVAAPASAGIPVTHRGIARSFAVVTASTAGTAHAPDAADLGRVATAVDTLVLLMAAGKLEDLPGADRRRSSFGRAGRDHPVGDHPGGTERDGHARGAARLGGRGRHRAARDPSCRRGGGDPRGDRGARRHPHYELAGLRIDDHEVVRPSIEPGSGANREDLVVDIGARILREAHTSFETPVRSPVDRSDFEPRVIGPEGPET